MDDTNQYFPKATNVLIDDIRQIVVVKTGCDSYKWFDMRKDGISKKIVEALQNYFHERNWSLAESYLYLGNKLANDMYNATMQQYAAAQDSQSNNALIGFCGQNALNQLGRLIGGGQGGL